MVTILNTALCRHLIIVLGVPFFVQGMRVDECILAARSETSPAIKLHFYQKAKIQELI
jgi:uncharacterized protein (UPF0128 family)